MTSLELGHTVLRENTHLSRSVKSPGVIIQFSGERNTSKFYSEVLHPNNTWHATRSQCHGLQGRGRAVHTQVSTANQIAPYINQTHSVTRLAIYLLFLEFRKLKVFLISRFFVLHDNASFYLPVLGK